MINKLILPAFLLLITGVVCYNSKKSITYPAGGYAYSKNIAIGDTAYFFLPLQRKRSFEDSMAYADTRLFFISFNERNLSIKYTGEDIFRLSIDGMVTSTVITITANELIVKQPAKGTTPLYPEEEPNQLPEPERMDYYFLRKHFPFTRDFTPARRQYIDSMLKARPFLRDITYYRYLKDKATVKYKEPYKYTMRSISLNAGVFDKWVASVNVSGYWKLPYRNDCTAASTDGYGFMLEANTKEKYNMVCCTVCQNNADTDKLKKACQQLLDYAGINDIDLGIL